MLNIEQYINKYRADFDRAEPGTWTDFEKIMKRVETGDHLERFVLCNKPLIDQAPFDMAGVWRQLETQLHPANDQLENFIRQNRAAFDTEAPDLSNWVNISMLVPEKSKGFGGFQIKIGQKLLRAAATITLLITVLGAGIWYGRTTATNQGMAMGELSTEYAEIENYYEREINTKQGQLAHFTGSHTTEINEDLQQMDLIMDELRKELADVPPGNREQVVKAMIENYKAKVAVLQRVLERLENNNTRSTNIKKYETDTL